MFNGQKVTEDNIKRISDELLSDPGFRERLCLKTASDGERDSACVFEYDNFYRLVYYFISIVELLSRQDRLSCEEFKRYENALAVEIRNENYASHIERCRRASIGEDDFITKAAEILENSYALATVVVPRLNFVAEIPDLYNEVLELCLKEFS